MSRNNFVYSIHTNSILTTTQEIASLVLKSIGFGYARLLSAK